MDPGADPGFPTNAPTPEADESDAYSTGNQTLAETPMGAPGRPARQAAPADGRYADHSELLGQGGLGRVESVLDRKLGREVARKELILDSAALRARFLREARVTAQLEHPGIVPVYDIGERANGRPWYTMRRIHGRTLGSALRTADGLAGRLALLPNFEAACQAVAYAHARGVVHRDLKPENVMVGDFGETLVVDWGIAKIRGTAELEHDPVTDDGSQSAMTRVGATLGTPAYMSPEQARGDPDAVDARSDVWGLGAILFELLAGKPPFSGVPADTAVERLRTGNFERIRDAMADAPPDLVAIVQKALAIEPSERYQDASALAGDIARWRSGGLVDAYRYSLVELIRKTVRRHAAPVAVAAVAAVALLAGGVVAFASVMSQRDRAVEAEIRAEAEGREANHRLARSLSAAALHELGRGDGISALVLSVGSLRIEESSTARGALLAASADPLPTRTGTIAGGPGLVGVWYAPDGRIYALADEMSEVRDFTTLEPIRTHRGLAPDSFAVSAGGRRIWIVGGEVLADEAPSDRWLATGNFDDAQFVDETRVVLIDYDGAIAILDVVTGEMRWSAHRSVVRYTSPTILPGGRIALGQLLGPPVIWDPETDAMEPLGDGSARFVAAGAGVIATAGEWGGGRYPVRVWTEGGSVDVEGTDTAREVAMSRDGKRLAVRLPFGVAVYDGPEWHRAAFVPAPGGLSISMSPGGDELYVADAHDLFRYALPPRTGARPHDSGTVWDVRFTEDGSRFVSGGDGGVLRICDTATGELQRSIPLGAGISVLSIVGDDAIVSTDDDRLVRVALADGAQRWEVPFTGILNEITPYRGGALLAVHEGDVARISPEGVVLWRRKFGAGAVGVFEARDHDLIVVVDSDVVRVDPDGNELSRFTYDGTGTDAGRELPDGTFVLTAIGRILHTQPDGTRLDDWVGTQRDRMRTLEVSPDGRFVATGSDDGFLCVWTAQGVEKACFPAHESNVWRASFSPDGSVLATAGGDGTASRWPLDGLDWPASELERTFTERHGLVAGDGAVLQAPTTLNRR